MSSENIRLAETIREDILTCPICYEIFEDARTLPCLHTYCRSCLSKLIENKFKKVRVIHCPECRSEVRLFKNGVDDIKPSFFIHSLMEIYNTKRQIVSCTVCKQRGEHRDAISKCTTCGDGLCFQCSSGHLQSTLTVSHKVVPLKDFTSGIHDSKLRESQNFPCTEHKKELEYYCSSCEVVACLSCVLLDHKDHMYSSIQRAYTTKKTHLEAMFNQVKSKFTDIETAKEQIEELKYKTSRKGVEVMKAIGSVGESVIKSVGREVTETKKKVDKMIKPRTESLSKIAENIDEKIKQGKNAIDFCSKILETGKPTEVLQIESLLRKRLEQLSEDAKTFDVGEIELNNRIDDVFVNERFKGEIHLGIFDPEPETRLNETQVSNMETQTEEIIKSDSNLSPEVPDSSLFGLPNDSGLYSLNQSVEDQYKNDTGFQSISQSLDAGAEGDVALPQRLKAPFANKENLQAGNGEPAADISFPNIRELQPRGHNWFTDIPGDMTYSSQTVNPSGPTNPAYFDDVIKQMIILIVALILMVLSPSVCSYVMDISGAEAGVTMIYYKLEHLLHGE